jgi:hypothetical protein
MKPFCAGATLAVASLIIKNGLCPFFVLPKKERKKGAKGQESQIFSKNPSF